MRKATLSGGAGSTRSQVAEDMLAEVVAHVRAHGLDGFTLRGCAKAIGTSHRMLVHYFGSRDELLAEVFHALRQEDLLRFDVQERSLVAAVRAIWAYYADDANVLRATLFFDLVAAAMRRPQDFRELIESLEGWTTWLARLGVEEGVPPEEAEVRARALLAGLRGLILQVRTGTPRHVCDSAAEQLLAALYPALVEPVVSGRLHARGR